MNTYRAGIDIGSTTVKLVLLDEEGKLLFGEYRRHCAHTQEALSALLREAREQVGDCALRAKITGSGAINLAKALGIPFVQEVVAVADALRREAPQTDVAIELGGEDAKIIYFGTTLEERMNGVCAGGTGSFIDQTPRALTARRRSISRSIPSPRAAACLPRRISSLSSTRGRPRRTLPYPSFRQSSTRPSRALPAASRSAATSRSSADRCISCRSSRRRSFAR